MMLPSAVSVYDGLWYSKNYVCQVGVWWIGFQMTADAVVQPFNLSELLSPLLAAAAVGEDKYTTSCKRCHLFLGQSPTAGCGKPYELGHLEGHDEGRLLALNDGDGRRWTSNQQVLAEETLRRLIAEWKSSLQLQAEVHPALPTETVPVGAVAHDVSSTDALLVVYLPENDVALTCRTNKVLVEDTQNVVRRDTKTVGSFVLQPLPEGAHRAMTSEYQTYIEFQQRLRLGLDDRAWHGVLPVFLTVAQPRLVAEILRWTVVVTARLLMVAAPHVVADVLEVVVGVNVAHKTVLASALRTGGLLLAMTRDAG